MFNKYFSRLTTAYFDPAATQRAKIHDLLRPFQKELKECLNLLSNLYIPSCTNQNIQFFAGVFNDNARLVLSLLVPKQEGVVIIRILEWMENYDKLPN